MVVVASASLAQPIYAADSNAIVRVWDCHCPFKQIDHRPTGRSIEQSAGKREKNAPADAVEKLSRQKFPPVSYYGTLAVDRKSLAEDRRISCTHE